MKTLPIFLVLLAAFAWANEYAERGPAGEPFYLSKDVYAQLKPLMKTPPQKGSGEQMKDEVALMALQKTRTADDCARANSEVKVTFESFFGKPYGPLSEDEIKKYSSLWDKVDRDAKYFSSRLKKEFARERPFEYLTEVKPCLPKEHSKSYPSGHALLARLFADVLDELLPERRAAIDARGAQIASDRVLGGVHHPTDIEFGQKMADALFVRLKESKSFQADLQSARH